MPKISNLELTVGITLIVFGVVLLVTQFQIPFVADGIGVLLVGTSVFFLYKGRLRYLMVALALLGVLLLLADKFADFGQAVNQVLSIAIGVIMFLLGIAALLGKFRPRRAAGDEAEAPDETQTTA